MVTGGKPVLDCANEAQFSLERAEFCKSSHAARFQNSFLGLIRAFQTDCCSLDLQFAFQALANLYKTEVTAGRIKAERSSLAGLHSLSSQFKSGTGW